MRYALGLLRQPGERKAVDIRDPLPPGAGVEPAGLVEGHLELTNGGSSVSARGWLRVPVKVECGRCLQEFDQLLEIEVNEDCALAQVDMPEAQLIAAGQAGQIPILNEEELDLSELVRQLVAVNLPTRPLCQPDCPGLCPQCGHDLSQGLCGCDRGGADPRWSALKDLRL